MKTVFFVLYVTYVPFVTVVDKETLNLYYADTLSKESQSNRS
jgi:hypothetical protein